MTSRSHPVFHALIALLLLCVHTAQAGICRVTPTGTDDGSDWSQAAALQDALADTTCTEIWVAQGTYTPDGGSNDRAAHFAITRNLRLYGGFAGDEATSDERASTDPALTILSGDIGVPGLASDNSYKLIHIDTYNIPGGITAETVIDGFTIRDAYDTRSFAHPDRNPGPRQPRPRAGRSRPR